MRTYMILLIAACLVGVTAESGAPADRPWWEEERIRFFWGQWEHHAAAGVGTEELMRNLARVGATVFVTGKHRADEAGPSGFDADAARLAQANGVRYFAGIFGSYLRERGANMEAPLAVKAGGGRYFGYGRYATIPMHCPLHEPLYEQHLLEPLLAAAATGAVDGVLLDWEPYGRVEPGVCYCDRCFDRFAQGRDLDVAAANLAADSRHAWLQAQDLAAAYAAHHEERRATMFGSIRDRIHEVKPDFVFAGYHVHDWSMRAGLHTAAAPFFVVDMRNYWDDHTRPWWDSFAAHERDLGYIRIAGSYNITFFGFQPESDVGAAQWLYDAAVNTDGFWLWFEEELGSEMWRSFWLADCRLRETEQKVGEFLFRAVPDPHFALPIEWSGAPGPGANIRQRSFHLGHRHLVQVNNVDADRALQVRLRLPRLPVGSRWIVEDPIAGLSYRNDDGAIVWTSEQLDDGLIVALQKRAELFLRLRPAAAVDAAATPSTVSGHLTVPMPTLAAADLLVAAAQEEEGVGTVRDLLYTRTEDMGYRHSRRGTGWSLANAVWTAAAGGSDAQRLLQGKAYLWTPVFSPDGTRIAFCRYADGRGQICVAGADGAAPVNVSGNSHCDRDPVWSPDSSRLAFVTDRAGSWDIAVMSADGSGQRLLTSAAGVNRAPTWAPDSMSLAFETDRDGDMDIYVMDAAGTGQRPLVRGPGDQKRPAWAPDGKRIAFVGLGWVYPDLSVATVATGAVRSVAECVTYVGTPRWAPDGKRIAAVYRRNDFGSSRRISGIMVVDAGGYAHLGNDADKHAVVEGAVTAPYHGGRRDPSFIPTWYSRGSASPRWTVQTFSDPVWSADGTMLAFSANLDEDGYFHVCTVTVAAGSVRKLPDSASAWLQTVDWTAAPAVQ